MVKTIWLNATMFTWQCNQWKISPWNKKNSHQNPFCLIGNLRSVSRGLDFGTWSRFGRNCSRCYFFNKTQSWYIEYFANIQSANTRCVKSVLDGLLFFYHDYVFICVTNICGGCSKLFLLQSPFGIIQRVWRINIVQTCFSWEPK